MRNDLFLNRRADTKRRDRRGQFSIPGVRTTEPPVTVRRKVASLSIAEIPGLGKPSRQASFAGAHVPSPRPELPLEERSWASTLYWRTTSRCEPSCRPRARTKTPKSSAASHPRVHFRLENLTQSLSILAGSVLHNSGLEICWVRRVAGGSSLARPRVAMALRSEPWNTCRQQHGTRVITSIITTEDNEPVDIESLPLRPGSIRAAFFGKSWCAPHVSGMSTCPAVGTNAHTSTERKSQHFRVAVSFIASIVSSDRVSRFDGPLLLCTCIRYPARPNP